LQLLGCSLRLCDWQIRDGNTHQLSGFPLDDFEVDLERLVIAILKPRLLVIHMLIFGRLIEVALLSFFPVNLFERGVPMISRLLICIQLLAADEDVINCRGRGLFFIRLEWDSQQWSHPEMLAVKMQFTSLGCP